MTRRQFLQTTAAPLLAQGAAGVPWYRRVCRWGQTNISEHDPPTYDIAFWRDYWKRTRIGGVIVNAGGIVAFYPSKFPLHHRAEFLGGRDLYGDLTRAAHADGLAVLARMDCSGTAEDFYRAHPDWFTRDAEGNPYRSNDKFLTCVNSAYYDEYIPSLLEEIIQRSHPEGFADNHWAGLGRSSICFCDSCARKFRAKSGRPLPRRKNWDDAIYRQWIEWNYARRLELWDFFNKVTRGAGGPDCLWIGINSGSISSQSGSFRDFLEICRRAEFMLLDHQSRNDATGFQQNGATGKLVHGLLGWDKLMPESMALYQNGRPTYRLTAKPAAESRMWMIEGIAGGIQPWWHHIGATHEDRRAYRIAEPIFRWHEEYEQYLIHRRPVAAVGVVWSQRNTDYYGRDDAANSVDDPYRGFTQALLAARIPYIPVNAEHIERDGPELAALILPNLGAMSDRQCEAVRSFVERGGSLIATGASSLYNEWGERRADFALADLFGAHAPAEDAGRRWGGRTMHSYLRIAEGPRHAVLLGFDETSILPFGGMLEPIRVDQSVTVPLTFVPPFPTMPPETAWMREPKTNIAALVLRTKGNARVAWLAADLDRRYAHDNLPDHANLLANLVRWAVGEKMPIEVKGPGMIDCHLCRQPGRLILHLVNLTSAATWRAPLTELIPIGPVSIKIKLPREVRGSAVQSLVSGSGLKTRGGAGSILLEFKSIADHEVVVIS